MDDVHFAYSMNWFDCRQEAIDRDKPFFVTAGIDGHTNTAGLYAVHPIRNDGDCSTGYLWSWPREEFFNVRPHLQPIPNGRRMVEPMDEDFAAYDHADA